MRGITVTLPDELLERIREIARERGVSVSALAREALERKAARYGSPSQRAKPKSIGAGASKYTDTARSVASEPQPPISWR